MICNNKLLPSLNVTNGNKSPYASKVILRHYNYWYDPKLGRVFFPLEEFHEVDMLAQTYYIFVVILKSKNQLISLYTEEFII